MTEQREGQMYSYPGNLFFDITKQMYPSPDQNLTYATDSSVYFFTSPFYPFDSFSAHTVTLWGQTFPTAEHAYQWKKFEVADSKLAAKILAAGSPEIANRLSKRGKKKPSDWDDRKFEAMREILTAKVAQHEDLRELLMATGQKTIVENSPTDSYWGAGPHGTGQNHIGRILMQLRDELQ